MHDVFPQPLLKRGGDLLKQGHVLNLRFSDGLLVARVKGNPNHLFNVHLDLKTWPKLPARCSCSQKTNCEHAVACLYALNKSQGGEAPTGGTQGQFELPAEEEIIEADELEWFSKAEAEGPDFFAYQLGIVIQGKVVSVVPLIADLIRRWDLKTIEGLSDKLILKLPFEDQKVLKIELGRLKPLLRLIFQYQLATNLSSEDLPLKQYQLLLMLEAEQALAASKARWQAGEPLIAKLNQLKTVQALPQVAPPIGLNAQLRDYQQQGLNWLQILRQSYFSGILADDMGLGKTIQTLAHLQLEKETGRMKKPSLIVAPTSLVSNWEEEAKRFTPSLRCLVFHGSNRHKGNFEDYDLIISTYGLIQRDKTRFLKTDWYYLILDEAQLIKNARTKTTQIIQQIKADHRLCLTGTPLENHLGELWSLFHFLMPGLLGDLKQFRHFFQIPIEREGNAERRQHLVHRIEPFMLRRTKNEVVKELPAKTETIIRIELSGAQRDLYEAIRMSMEQKVREAIADVGIGRCQILFLDALLKLRQICCDPRLLKLEEAAIAKAESAKLKTLMDLIDNLMEEGRRVLVFSQFTSMLGLIEKALQEKGYAYFKLTGQSQNRAALVRDFQAEKAPIFLISLKAGGIGLNLTKADTVIHYDLWWNPAAEDQATDRSHRIGQKNPVFVYKLITNGTVEEAILDMQIKKRQLVQGILSEKMAIPLGLQQEDIDKFFSPLTD